MRICPVSGSTEWNTFYNSMTNRIMTGDQRIIEGKLRKIICPHSGVVANERSFTSDELALFYGNDYQLNTLGKEEHYFYTTDGPIARSDIFFDWIDPYLPEGFDTLVEIGCGEGNLLKRFAAKYPKKNILGFDGSFKATELAKNKGLFVQQKLILGEELLPRSDAFILVNIIEHLESIVPLISSLKNALNKNGRIIFCLPIQDYGGYDIFFAEHVWHFTSNHILTILERNGLKTVYNDIDHPINHGIGMFVCEKKVDGDYSTSDFSNIISRNLIYWKSKFQDLDDFLTSSSFGKIAVFGAGEIFTLFMTFTSLAEQKIIACIDDSKMPGDKKHDIPIYNSEWLKLNSVDLLLLAVNNKYHSMIKDKLKHINLDIKPIY